MSGRTAPRFALAGFLTATFATVAGAQTPPAPMPRPAVGFGIEIDIDLSFADVLDRVRKVRPPCCAFDCPARTGVAVAPVPREAASRIDLHGDVLGAGESRKTRELQRLRDYYGVPPSRLHLPAAAAVALPPSPAVERCEGVVRGTPAKCGTADLRVVYPLDGVTAIRRDDTGTWWVEAGGVPQPKHSQPVPRSVCGATAGALVGTAVDRPAADKAGKLSGTWVRDLEGVVIAATFTGDELKLCVTQKADLGGGEAVTVTLTLTADCAVTKDGVVHGVFTGADLRTTGGKDGDVAAFAVELAEGAAKYRQVVETPFLFRVKHTSAGVMVNGFKAAELAGLGGQEVKLLAGLYAPCADGKVPAPKPMKPQTWTGELTLPSPKYLDHAPQYFVPGPPVAQKAPPVPALPPLPQPGTFTPAGTGSALPGTQGMLPPAAAYPSAPATLPQPGLPVQGSTGFSAPALPAPAPQASWNPTPPANVPPGDFGMMAATFGQMLGVNNPPPVPQLLPPAPTMPQSVPCSPPIQLVGGPGPSLLPPAPTGPPTAKPALVGTWVREVGPVVYVITIAPDHLTITATGATEFADGKTTTEGMTITADYHVGRDGTTLVGLITSVDGELGGSATAEAGFQQLGEELSRLQKALTDKPFALGVRVYDNVLVIGNVRLPQVEGDRGAWSPLSTLGGRYASAGNKPVPTPKAVKSSAALPPLPPPGAGNLPQRAQELRDAGQRTPASDERIPPPSVSANPPPAPPAPAPTPTEPKPRKKGKKGATEGFLLNVYSSDPTVRMQQLLHESEDLRQIKNEWHRFWFNDQPSHLAPERIHGGILGP